MKYNRKAYIMQIVYIKSSIVKGDHMAMPNTPSVSESKIF